MFGNVSTEKSSQTTSIYIYNHICITTANRGIHLSQHIYLSFAGRKGNTLGFDPKGPSQGPLGAGSAGDVYPLCRCSHPKYFNSSPNECAPRPRELDEVRNGRCLIWGPKLRYLKWPSIFIGTYRNHDIVVIPAAKSPWNVWGAPIFLAVDGHPQRASPFVGS